METGRKGCRQEVIVLPKCGNERGIALLIVLLVTALLIALIFEFSYATRISLNNAVSFRDSQRAYFLARSGITAFLKYGKELREFIPQGEWGVVPMISEGDTEVNIMWEDQRGLININTVSNFNWLENLFTSKQIGTDVVDKVKALKQGQPPFLFVSQLHAVMSDEDYNKVADFLTVYSDNFINVNTASEDVLNSVLEGNRSEVETIINTRKDKQITSLGEVGLNQQTVKNVSVLNSLKVDGAAYKVYSYTTVGGYTKKVEAIVNGNTISYWRAL